MAEKNEFDRMISEANERGRFEGQVLTSLVDIKRVLDDMKAKHAEQDAKIDGKVGNGDFKEIKKDVEELKKFRWILAGGLTILSLIFSKVW